MDKERNYLAYGDTVIKMLENGGYELKYNIDAHIKVINELSVNKLFESSRNGLFTLTYLNINLLEAILKEKIRFKAKFNKTDIVDYEELELICLIDKHYSDVEYLNNLTKILKNTGNIKSIRSGDELELVLSIVKEACRVVTWEIFCRLLTFEEPVSSNDLSKKE